MNSHVTPSVNSFFSGDIVVQALKDSIKKFHPKRMVKNPVMFVVAVGSAITTIIAVQEVVTGHPSAFNIQVTV